MEFGILALFLILSSSYIFSPQRWGFLNFSSLPPTDSQTLSDWAWADFLPLLQQQTAVPSTLPAVATDLSRGSDSEYVFFIIPSRLCFLWERDSEIDRYDFLPVCHQGWLSWVLFPTSLCLTSTWWGLTEITGKWMWILFVSRTPRCYSKLLCQLTVSI